MHAQSPSALDGPGAEPAATHARFTIKSSSEGEAHVIRVAGELDLFELPRLERALDEAEAVAAERVLLDLEALTFIDAAGLHALLAACRRSAQNGNRLRVTRGRGNVADMFRLTALDMTLPFASPDPDQRASPALVPAL